MEDLYDTSNEIQDILARSYGVPEGFDEADLDAGKQLNRKNTTRPRPVCVCECFITQLD